MWKHLSFCGQKDHEIFLLRFVARLQEIGMKLRYFRFLEVDDEFLSIEVRSVDERWSRLVQALKNLFLIGIRCPVRRNDVACPGPGLLRVVLHIAQHSSPSHTVDAVCFSFGEVTQVTLTTTSTPGGSLLSTALCTVFQTPRPRYVHQHSLRALRPRPNSFLASSPMMDLVFGSYKVLRPTFAVWDRYHFGCSTTRLMHQSATRPMIVRPRMPKKNESSSTHVQVRVHKSAIKFQK